MRSDIHATRRIGQQGSLPTFAAPAQTVPKTTDFGTVLKVGSADEVTIGRIEPKVCCRGEEIKKRSIFEDCESRQRGRGHSWLGPVILARQYSCEARLAQLAPSVEHQTQVVARGALVQFYFRQEGWRAHT
jgi:hypothetical protein